MAIFQTQSRYQKQADTSTSSVIQIALRKQPSLGRYTQYTTVQGESFASIAARVFNNPERYWEIADLNPHVPYPDMIPTGTVIRIPAT